MDEDKEARLQLDYVLEGCRYQNVLVDAKGAEFVLNMKYWMLG